ncbi:hypothetical protein NU09_3187 [Flavobacterium beibuense]|uniref:Uncharacterized protein n=1 Tax=Flavobacterium beibuense TaxID=657326 RepID=A0A444W5T3_9FLAO|nr:hypothetical protein NU09_3187 [Flavobacterium beibuense]
MLSYLKKLKYSQHIFLKAKIYLNIINQLTDLIFPWWL